MRLLMMLLAVLLLPVPAMAAYWYTIDYDRIAGKPTNYTIDKESILQQEDGHFRVWMRAEKGFLLSACDDKDSFTCHKKENFEKCQQAFNDCEDNHKPPIRFMNYRVKDSSGH